MLATDVFKLVIGQQDFQQGRGGRPAPAGAGGAHVRRRLAACRRKQTRDADGARGAVRAEAGARLRPRDDRATASLVSALMLAVLGMAVFASFVKLWPYDLSLEPAPLHASAWSTPSVGDAFVNSLQAGRRHRAASARSFVFVGAYLLEKTRGMDALRPLVRLLAMLPMAVPGLVLGLGYIFFFNAPGQPAATSCTSTMTILVRLHHRPLLHDRPPDRGDGAEGARRRVRGGVAPRSRCRSSRPSGASRCRSARRRCSTSRRYFFVNAMTTISAVVFLYSPDTKVASIAILNLDEAGEIGAAAAMAMLIVAASTRGDAALHARVGALHRPAHPGLARGRRAERRSSRQTNDHGDCNAPRPDPPDPRPADDDRSAPSTRCCATGARGTARSTPSPPSCAAQLLTIVHGEGTHVVRAAAGQRHVLGRGGGRRRSCRATATCWCSINGAYCKRIGEAATLMGRKTTILRDCRGRAGRRRRTLEAAAARRPAHHATSA